MNIRLTATALLVGLSIADTHAQSQTAPDAWFRPSTKPKDFSVAKLPWNSFSIELPKDWQMVPGYGGILLTAVEKTRNNQAIAAIALEQMLLVEPLAANDIDAVLAGLEEAAARQRDPAGKDFAQQVKEADGRRFVFIQYSRPGLNGLDRVVQYAIPSGRVMYRLICIAPDALLTTKYQAMFAHVARSFKPSGAASN
jgi:hypothetical protein